RLYGLSVARLLRISLIMLVLYAGLLGLTYFGFTTTPVGFIPIQDKGYLLLNAQLPDASSVQRTSAVMAQINDIILGPLDPKTGLRDRSKGQPGVSGTVGISGLSIVLGANSPNFGTMFVTFKPFDERKHDYRQNGFQILFDLQDKIRREVMDAQV